MDWVDHLGEKSRVGPANRTSIRRLLRGHHDVAAAHPAGPETRQDAQIGPIKRLARETLAPRYEGLQPK